MEIRRRTRRHAKDKSKNTTSIQASGTISSVSTTCQTRKRAIQGIAQEGETAAKGKDRKRAKKEQPSYLQRSHEAEIDPNHSIRLLNLPRDIFQEITTWLESDALTCLTLTCKEILRIVGQKPWIPCQSKRGYWDESQRWWIYFRHSLILLLCRDAPHLTYCDACVTIHPPLKPPREHRETVFTKRCFGQWSSIDYLPKDELGGYNLLWEHIAEARESLTSGSENKVGSPIELLYGSFTVRHERFNYTLKSSGRQVGKNLVVKHEHIFHGVDSRSPLRVADIIALPVRLCPHQTTSTQKPEPNRYTKSRLPSGLLFHSIATAVPASLWSSIPTPSMFSNPSPSENKQVDTAISAKNALWTCRACPTKWRVQHSGEEARELKITV